MTGFTTVSTTPYATISTGEFGGTLLTNSTAASVLFPACVSNLLILNGNGTPSSLIEVGFNSPVDSAAVFFTPNTQQAATLVRTCDVFVTVNSDGSGFKLMVNIPDGLEIASGDYGWNFLVGQIS